jgi:transposase
LAKAGLPVFCIETRHTKAFLDALQQNESDRNDARGIAHMMRVGLFKNVHVKTLTSQKPRALLTARSLLQEKAIDLENEMRAPAQLRTEGRPCLWRHVREKDTRTCRTRH